MYQRPDSNDHRVNSSFMSSRSREMGLYLHRVWVPGSHLSQLRMAVDLSILLHLRLVG